MKADKETMERDALSLAEWLRKLGSREHHRRWARWNWLREIGLMWSTALVVPVFMLLGAAAGVCWVCDKISDNRTRARKTRIALAMLDQEPKVEEATGGATHAP